MKVEDKTLFLKPILGKSASKASQKPAFSSNTLRITNNTPQEGFKRNVTLAAKKYTFSFFMNKGLEDLNDKEYFNVDILNSANAIVYTYTTKVNATGYYNFDYSATTAGTYTWRFRRVSLNGRSSSGIAYFDDFKASYTIQQSQQVCSSPKNYRFGFNGQEKESDIYGENNVYDFGARIYDARIGKFLSTDPDEVYYPFYSPYVFAGNSVITHVDAFGLGPRDRVRHANSHLGKRYVLETDWELRTGNSAEAQAIVDCSELVCRVLSADGLMKLHQSVNTAGLISRFNSDKWVKSNYPKVGDVFLWRSGSHGHTGIVTEVNGNLITIIHARGKDFGTREEDYKLSYFTGHKGWKGFYRPITETDNSKSNKFNSPQSLMSDIKRQQDAFQKQMDNFMWNIKSKQLNNIKYKNNDIIKSNKNGSENSNNSGSENSNNSGSDNSNSNNTRFVSPRYVNQ
jgi:RHS repeat-associated protein